MLFTVLKRATVIAEMLLLYLRPQVHASSYPPPQLSCGASIVAAP